MRATELLITGWFQEMGLVRGSRSKGHLRLTGGNRIEQTLAIPLIAVKISHCIEELLHSCLVFCGLDNLKWLEI